MRVLSITLKMADQGRFCFGVVFIMSLCALKIKINVNKFSFGQRYISKLTYQTNVIEVQPYSNRVSQKSIGVYSTVEQNSFVQFSVVELKCLLRDLGKS